MKADKAGELDVYTSAQPANRAAIAEILADVQDDPMCNKAVRIAHEVLRQVPGAAFDGEPFMLTGIARVGDQQYVACNCFYHTVLILEDWAFVYSREEGGMVPWLDTPKVAMPKMDYFDSRVAIEPGLRSTLLAYVRQLQDQRQASQSEHGAEEEALSAPSM